MAILSNGKFYGFLCSVKETGRKLANGVKEYVEDFVSGFAGHGWKLWEYVTGKWMLEIDSIRIREQFIVFEMLVSKMRAIIGSLGISQACGKIATVTLSEDGTEYLITLEDETMSFVAHDFMRCQTYTGTKQMFYHVEISAVADDVIHVPVSEFNIDAEGIVINPPKPGNDIVQFGNSQDKTRQSAIYIHADKSGQPAIDIMFDIDSKDWTGKIKTRLGGDLPGGDGARGFYCENGMIKGVDTSGHTVYCIYPNGTAEFGDGSAAFRKDKSGFIAGGAISWIWDEAKGKCVCTMQDVVLTWDNLSDEVKQNLKGKPGKDGLDGINGKDGKVYYTWMRYADTDSGEGISNNPTGKIYIGLAYNKETATESNNPSDYTWSRFRGENGTDGIPGPAGADGKTTYTWLAYSDNADGSGMYQIPNDKTKYIGIAVNKDTTIESSNPADYTWSKFRGEDGKPGQDANLLPWIEKWNGYATELGEEYIVTPKMFSGTKTTNSEGKVLLTGIAQGKDCLTAADGTKRTGIFALVNNEIVFELDPISKRYKFTGEVQATSGIFNNVIVNNSILKDVKINGTVSQPWARSGIYVNIGSDEKVTYDNIASGSTGGWGDGSILGMITWTLADSGRIIRIANWKYDGVTFTGTVNIPAPSGMYFFEDGIQKSELTLSREVVEMIGYGDSKNFYGWIVLNRIDLMPTKRYGQNFKILATGTVNEVENGAYIQYKTYDGGSMSVVRRDTGKYIIWIPWDTSQYTVFLTGRNSAYGGGPIKASLADIFSNSFEVHTSDNSNRHDGSFSFMVVSTADWK